MEYLYHYTSLETLALILSQKTLCFNSLINVDDIEEAETKDMGNFGRFVFVSCWTIDEKESIPLWKLYTPDMHGVRLRLPIYPFKKYHYKKGEFHLKEDVITYINIERFHLENNFSIVPNALKLIEVKYTENEEELFPNVRNVSDVEALERYLNASSLDEIIPLNVNYSFKNLGICKREDWRFQKEWRYIITTSPVSKSEQDTVSLKSQQEVIRSLENRDYILPQSRLFIELDDNIFSKLEVVFGPKMNDAEKVIAQALLKEYAPDCVYRNSCLRIR